MKIRIAHSPDSDDAFMFYGLATGRVPSEGFELEHVLSDIETLNRDAFDGKYEITAVSFHAYAHLTDRYMLLPHGASMGDRYGPVVVAKADGPSSLDGVRVAVPGELTTAFLTLRLFDPSVQHVVVPFDEIQERVHTGEFAAGLLIHEGQVTYAEEGLKKIVDLGEWWADRTGGLPLPLGGNVIRRDLGAAVIGTLSRLLHDSIAYGLEHRDEAIEHAMQFGRGLDRTRTDRFVGMYVNGLTLDYGERGRIAVARLLGDAEAAGLLPTACGHRICRGRPGSDGPEPSLPPSLRSSFSLLHRRRNVQIRRSLSRSLSSADGVRCLPARGFLSRENVANSWRRRRSAGRCAWPPERNLRAILCPEFQFPSPLARCAAVSAARLHKRQSSAVGLFRSRLLSL